MSIEVFMSYSHKDEGLRDELEVHLAMLKHQGLITTWHDRRINSGDNFDSEISQAMVRSKVILLLVSPDFLASKYCYDIEITKAIEMNNEGVAKVIPIILRPCEWKQVPLFKKLTGAPKDNVAVTKWPNRDDAFLDITTRIRNVVEKFHSVTNQPIMLNEITSSISHAALPRSSNLRITKNFSDFDRDEFLEQGFNFMRKFFEGSLQELCKRSPELNSRIKDIDNTAFTCTLYSDQRSVSSCSIFLGGVLGNGISYSSGESFNRSTLNECLIIDNDDQKLFFSPIGMINLGRQNKDQKLTFEGGAELYWSNFISPLQR